MVNSDFFLKLDSLKKEYAELVIATLVDLKGSAPQERGAKIIVGPEGLLFGTVGGGKVEKKVIEHAQSLFSHKNQNDFQSWNLQTDIGMTCGGVCSFYFEKIRSQAQWEVAIFGAGHVAQEVVRLLCRLECSVTCIDPRAEWLEKLPTHSHLKKIHSKDMKTEVAQLSPNTFVACMTMGHAFDLPILEEVYKNGKFPFVGAIGSESKSRTLKQDLLKLGFESQLVETLNCPIGESFGNNTPPEIAISIVAQLIIVRDRLKNLDL